MKDGTKAVSCVERMEFESYNLLRDALVSKGFG
jgi:hypothetical protein